MAAKIGKPQPSINTGRRKKTTMRWRLKEKGTNNNKKEKKKARKTNKQKNGVGPREETIAGATFTGSVSTATQERFIRNQTSLPSNQKQKRNHLNFVTWTWLNKESSTNQKTEANPPKSNTTQ